MRLRLALIAAATLLVASPALAGPRVLFSYADWCGACRRLEPKLVAAVGAVDDAELVYLDFTDLSPENMERQFERAAPLTRADFLEDGRFLKTGFAYVLDESEVGVILSSMSQDEIVEILEDAQSE